MIPDFRMLFQEARKKEGRGCFVAKINFSHPVFSERFDVLHFSRQHGKLESVAIASIVFSSRSSKIMSFSVLTYPDKMSFRKWEPVSCVFPFPCTGSDADVCISVFTGGGFTGMPAPVLPVFRSEVPFRCQS